jgi:hypothetical protein
MQYTKSQTSRSSLLPWRSSNAQVLSVQHYRSDFSIFLWIKRPNPNTGSVANHPGGNGQIGEKLARFMGDDHGLDINIIGTVFDAARYLKLTDPGQHAILLISENCNLDPTGLKYQCLGKLGILIEWNFSRLPLLYIISSGIMAGTISCQ